ncbi:hypothetical protein NF675_13770 [Pseudomonas siliginis]|uniref:hypothetical protein n=1 Tax=Pseudomonas siliginis TaxID=2842346 RepID=UPI002092F0C6|nr:hypothetical protein [Pseudomonas siliginis]UST72101.1 hypothetical protein NF675_13770 [Pseudomonas siliginis]
MQFISSDVPAAVDRCAPDKQERALIVQSLAEALKATEFEVSADSYSASASLPVATVFNVQDRFIPRVIGSSFDERCEPAQQCLQKFNCNPGVCAAVTQPFFFS